MVSADRASGPALDEHPVLVAPAAVRLISLDDPLRDLQLPRARAGGPYRSLLAIARQNGEPLGRAVIGVEEDGGVSRFRLDFELRRQLERQLGRIPGGLLGESAASAIPESESATAQDRRGGSISVVVTTCSNPCPLARCLRSILSCGYDQLEVIVVENRPGSVATRRMLAERFAGESRLRYIEEADKGLSCARNAGLAVADGDLVAFTDDDVIVDRAWLWRSAQAFRGGGDIACVTGLILPLELETDTQLLLEQFMALGKGFGREVFRLPDALERHPLLPYTAGIVGSGANTVLRADTARRLGGFDATLGTGTLAAGGEDLDLYIRLLRDGHAVAYEPGAIVWHAHPSGASKLRRQVYWYGVGFGAALAKQLFAGPERGQLLRAVPAGIGYLLNPSSRKNAGKTSGYPRRLEWLERLGMAVGPAGYLASAAVHRYRGLTAQRA